MASWAVSQRGPLVHYFPSVDFPKGNGKSSVRCCPLPFPQLSSEGDNDPFTHSQLQVLLVTLPICCHGCLAQKQLGELIHCSLAGEQFEPLHCGRPHCGAGFTHRPVSGTTELASPVPRGKHLPEDASQALSACFFLPRCNFFLFHGSDLFPTPPVSSSSSSFVRRAPSVCSGRTKPTQMPAKGSSTLGVFPGAGPGLGAQEAHGKPGICLFLSLQLVLVRWCDPL